MRRRARPVTKEREEKDDQTSTEFRIEKENGRA